VIDQAGPAIRACRDSRAALRPELSGALDVVVDIDGGGRAKEVAVKGTSPTADDAALNRCVEVVLSGLSYPHSGLTVTIEVKRMIELPPPRSTLRGRKCSPTSTLPLPLRRGVWRERLDRSAAWTVYLDAKASCELPTWTDRRTLLELVLGHVEDGLSRVDVARNLDRAGETDAATLIRRETVRRARTADELRSIQVALVGDEHYPLGTFKKQYKAAADDNGRLAVVRRFLGIAPHDSRLERRLLSLLESLGKKQELSDEVRRIRLDPFADAGLLADAASALRRIGDENESRRTFGELTERAPHDPWARAFLGDRLRNEGWFDDATLAYTVLEQLVPDEPAAIVRLALAHAGAGRLDIAHRMLSRVAQTGGRAGDAQLGELASRAAAALLAEARVRQGLPAEDADRLTRFAVELPHPAGATTLLLRAPAGALPIEATLVRGPKEAREERRPEIAAEGIGLYALRLDAGDAGDAVLRLRRREELAPAAATKVRVDALVPEGAGKPPKLASIEVELPITGKPVELRWDGSAWRSD
jgi:tetratricopeptide (TPR) repeat protein